MPTLAPHFASLLVSAFACSWDPLIISLSIDCDKEEQGKIEIQVTCGETFFQLNPLLFALPRWGEWSDTEEEGKMLVIYGGETRLGEVKESGRDPPLHSVALEKGDGLCF